MADGQNDNLIAATKAELTPRYHFAVDVELQTAGVVAKVIEYVMLDPKVAPRPTGWWGVARTATEVEKAIAQRRASRRHYDELCAKYEGVVL